jgi:hypothetical protein
MILGSALLFATPAAAQDTTSKVPPATTASVAQPTPTSLTAAQLDRLRMDVGTFEIVLQRAVTSAGQQFAQWAQQLLPNILLQQAAEPVVHGAPVADAGVVFHIEMAEMLGFNLLQARLRQQPPSDPVTGAPRNVTTAPRVGAEIVQGDPMNAQPPLASQATANAQYSEYVREALVDAILDRSGVLTLKDEQVLTIYVTPVDVAVSNPIYKSMSKTLILTIRGADLAALRQGRIPRDEAKRRITETRF